MGTDPLSPNTTVLMAEEANGGAANPTSCVMFVSSVVDAFREGGKV